MSGQLSGKVAIITGSTSGMGKAAAGVFSREGAKVVICGRRTDEGEAVTAEIREAGGEAIFVRTDVSIESDIVRLVEQTLKTYGRLDIAINNAGYSDKPAPFADKTAEEWNAMLAVNLVGMGLCMKHEIRAMLQTGGGVIVNNSSVAAVKALTGRSLHCIVKAGVNALTQVAAQEYAAQGIRINVVCPGLIPVKRQEAQQQKEKIEYAKLFRIPMDRPGEQYEVAETMLWLCSSKSSYITGQAIFVDGGMTTL